MKQLLFPLYPTPIATASDCVLSRMGNLKILHVFLFPGYLTLDPFQFILAGTQLFALGSFCLALAKF